MKKFHVAIGVSDIETSVKEYSHRLETEPEVVIPSHYALWRTDCLNLSIRKVSDKEAGKLRHLGWENPEATEFTTEYDCNHILWEEFTADHQAQEIKQTWLGTNYKPRGG